MITIETLRSVRIGPFTVFDTATAYIGVFLLAPLLTKLFSRYHSYISRTQWVWLTLPIAVVFHLALSLNTPFVALLFHFPSAFIAIPLLIFMLYMGLKDIKNPKNIE